MFGYSIIKTRDLDNLKYADRVYTRAYECRRWFSGWSELVHLFEYILLDDYYGGIERARKSYAVAHGSSVDGYYKE